MNAPASGCVGVVGVPLSMVTLKNRLKAEAKKLGLSARELRKRAVRLIGSETTNKLLGKRPKKKYKAKFKSRAKPKKPPRT